MGKTIYEREQHNERLIGRRLTQHVHPYFGWGVMRLYRRGEVLTWADEDARQRQIRLEAKKWLGRGGYQTHGGDGKSWRKAHRVKVRQEVRATLYRVRAGDIDAAEAVHTDPKANYLWDYW